MAAEKNNDEPRRRRDDRAERDIRRIASHFEAAARIGRGDLKAELRPAVEETDRYARAADLHRQRAGFAERNKKQSSNERTRRRDENALRQQNRHRKFAAADMQARQFAQA